MKHLQKLDGKLDLPLFSYGHWKCMFVDFLVEYISPPKLCSLLSVQQLILIFEDVFQSL